MLDDKTLRARRDELLTFFEHAPIKKTLGFDFRYDEEGRAIFEMPFSRHTTHALGDVHGGVIGVMIDNAGWFTAAPYFEQWIATVEYQVRLLEPARREAVIARGEIVRVGKRLATCEVDVRSASGRLVARGAGTFTVTGVKREPAATPV